LPVPSSCQEYLEIGNPEDGEFLIQPSRDLAPFNVQCQFGNETANTIIEKTHSEKAGFTSMPGMEYGCPTPGCFSDKITYEATMEQIEVF